MINSVVKYINDIKADLLKTIELLNKSLTVIDKRLTALEEKEKNKTQVEKKKPGRKAKSDIV